MRYALFLVALVLTLFVPRTGTAQSVPEAGVAAEAAGRWDEAIRVYRQVLDREPARGDLWIRIADIEASRGDLRASVTALNSAAQALPADPSVYRRLSQAYASSNQPRAAVEAIQGALALSPDDADYLSAAATLATWQGDYALAARSYLRLQEVGGASVDVALNLARVSAWAGQTDQAVNAYRRYLAAHPDLADVWLELARTESWRGNYAAALEALDVHRDRFGESDAYSRELAAILASSGQPSEAVKLLDPLLKQNPFSHELNVIRTIALAMQQRPRETFDASRLRSPAESVGSRDANGRTTGARQPELDRRTWRQFLQRLGSVARDAHRALGHGAVCDGDAIVCRIRASIARRAGTRRPRSHRRRLRAVRLRLDGGRSENRARDDSGTRGIRDGRNPQADAVRGQCAHSSFGRAEPDDRLQPRVFRRVAPDGRARTDRAATPSWKSSGRRVSSITCRPRARINSSPTAIADGRFSSHRDVPSLAPSR